MTISNSPTSPLASMMATESLQQDVEVAMLKKAQDAATQQGEAIVNMLEQVGPQAVAGQLDVYA